MTNSEIGSHIGSQIGHVTFPLDRRAWIQVHAFIQFMNTSTCIDRDGRLRKRSRDRFEIQFRPQSVSFLVDFLAKKRELTKKTFPTPLVNSNPNIQIKSSVKFIFPSSSPWTLRPLWNMSPLETPVLQKTEVVIFFFGGGGAEKRGANVMKCRLQRQLVYFIYLFIWYNNDFRRLVRAKHRLALQSVSSFALRAVRNYRYLRKNLNALFHLNPPPPPPKKKRTCLLYKTDISWRWDPHIPVCQEYIRTVLMHPWVYVCIHYNFFVSVQFKWR